jgi:hypothetical protein
MTTLAVSQALLAITVAPPLAIVMLLYSGARRLATDSAFPNLARQNGCAPRA